jgi:hypothetical protein
MASPLDELTPKERNMFFRGIGAGIVGGLLSNLVAGFLIMLTETAHFPTWVYLGLFVIVFCGFLYAIYLIAKGVENNS